MKQCDKCGTVNPDNARYCTNCGYELPKTTVVEKKATPQSTPQKTKKSRE